MSTDIAEMKCDYSQESDFSLHFSRILETEGYEDFINSQESNSERTLTATKQQIRRSCQIIQEIGHHIEDEVGDGDDDDDDVDDDGVTNNDSVANNKRSIKRVCLKMATDFPSENQVWFLKFDNVDVCVLFLTS